MKITLPRSTSIMVGLLILCAGILGGIQMQKAWGTTPTGTNADLAAAFQQRNQRPGGFTPTTNAPTTGTIKLVDGTTVYIETTDGRTITVNTDGNTKVSTTTPQTLGDLKAGQTITVTGSSSDATTMTASSISATPAS